jgi:hypothetical protein
LIKIETICEDNNNQDEDVISSEIMKMTQEQKSTRKEKENQQNDSVPATRRIVHEITLNKGAEPIPTDTIKLQKENT